MLSVHLFIENYVAVWLFLHLFTDWCYFSMERQIICRNCSSMRCLEITGFRLISYISLFGLINTWFDGENFEMLCCPNFDLFILKEETMQSTLRRCNIRWNLYYVHPNQTSLWKHSSDSFCHTWPSFIRLIHGKLQRENLNKAVQADEFAAWKEISECQILNKFLYFRNTERHSSQ